MARYKCGVCGRASLSNETVCPVCDAAGSYARDDTPLNAAKAATGTSKTALRADRALAGTGGSSPLVRLGTVTAADVARVATGIAEFDRVLGGGLVPGSLVLIAGEPGIGKSTLLAQAIGALVVAGHRSVYFSGEESVGQIGLRARRLGLPLDALEVCSTNSADEIAAQIAAERPVFAVVDSVQTIAVSENHADAGSPSQVKGSVQLLMQVAKAVGTTLLLVGQVNKDGETAGPKTLEHLVDAVLTFEGDRYGIMRFLRAAKNRFGAVDEVGIFEMGEQGLEGRADVAPLLLDGGTSFGRVVCPTLEGTRPLLVEVQALVGKATYSSPRRTALGVSEKRINMLLAVLERHADIDLSGHDVYVEVAAGLEVPERAIDAAVVVAIASSYWSTPVDPETAVCGEVALGSEIRPVSAPTSRLKETARRGFGTLVGPERGMPAGVTSPQIRRVRNVRELLDACGVLRPAGATPAAGTDRTPKAAPWFRPRRAGGDEMDADS